VFIHSLNLTYTNIMVEPYKFRLGKKLVQRVKKGFKRGLV